MLIIHIISGAILNRLRGSGLISKGVMQGVMAIYFVYLISLNYSITASMICGIIFIPAIAKSWGLVISCGTMTRYQIHNWEERYFNHWYDWFLTPLFGVENKTWTFKQRRLRDLAGLSIRGMFISVPIGIVLWVDKGFTYYLFSGAGMTLCYQFGYMIPDTGINAIDKYLGKGIGYGELIFGMYLFGTILIA